MNTGISLVLFLVMGLIGVIDARLRQPGRLIVSGYRSQEKPIMDPDDGIGRSFEQDKPRLDRFAQEMKMNNSADAYIMAFAGLVSYKNEVRIRLNCIRKYLTTVHGISRSRLRLINGGYRVEKSVKLFLVNPDDPKPTSFPTLKREDVTIRKAPKRPCG